MAHNTYLALGSNLGDRADHLRRALPSLAPEFVVGAVSGCYETAPAYVLDQPQFYNLACRATTEGDPVEALATLKGLETELGRQPARRHGPRVMDLDLLLYDDLILDTPELTLPHPRLHERSFVLVPLADIAPDLRHPRLGQTVATMLAALGDVTAEIWPAPDCDARL